MDSEETLAPNSTGGADRDPSYPMAVGLERNSQCSRRRLRGRFWEGLSPSLSTARFGKCNTFRSPSMCPAKSSFRPARVQEMIGVLLGTFRSCLLAGQAPGLSGSSPKKQAFQRLKHRGPRSPTLESHSQPPAAQGSGCCCTSRISI